MTTILTSCESDTKTAIKGLWSIDENGCIYKGEDISYCLLGNVINFENKSCELLSLSSTCNDSIVVAIEEKGIWELEEPNDSTKIIRITINNEIFNGEHEVYFEKDSKNKLLKMIIKSDKLYLKCTKGLFDYNKNFGLIERIIK